MKRDWSNSNTTANWVRYIGYTQEKFFYSPGKNTLNDFLRHKIQGYIQVQQYQLLAQKEQTSGSRCQ